MSEDKDTITKINIGIAGWSYPDWQGLVYPDTKTDKLEYVSRFVDCIEINSSFYRPPDKRLAQSWLKKVQEKEGFFFTGKLHKSFTHEGRIDKNLVREFHEGYRPLLENGKFKTLLVQFRYDFKFTKTNRQHLEKLVNCFKDSFNITIELRDSSWQSRQGLDFLDELEVSVCSLDYPVTWNSFNLDCPGIGRSGYMRLHGRNADKWFSKAGRDETYDYYYSNDELAEIKQRIKRLAGNFEEVTVIANNHYRGSELANVLQLKNMLTGEKQEFPEGLLRLHPELKKISSNKNLQFDLW